jgi:hypothetical protein
MQGQDLHEDETAGSSVEKAGNKEQLLVSELSDHDVLLGRGTGPNEHQGNKMLRSLVAKFQKEYNPSPSRKGRQDVARMTLQKIKKNKGRFLERASASALLGSSSSGEDDQDNRGDGPVVYYLVVDDNKAITKIKQAFRYNMDIQTPKYIAKRMFGESSLLFQEEVKDHKRTRLSVPASSPATGEHINYHEV